MAELDLGFVKIPSELTAIEKQPDSDGSYSFPCDGKKYTLLKEREVTPTFTLGVLFENASGNTTKGTYNISSSKFFADGVISCNFQFASARTRVDINEDGTQATTTTIVFTFVVNGVEKTFTYGTGLGRAYVLTSGSETLTVKNITKAVIGEASVTSAILANTAEYAETARTAEHAETAKTVTGIACGVKSVDSNGIYAITIKNPGKNYSTVVMSITDCNLEDAASFVSSGSAFAYNMPNDLNNHRLPVCVRFYRAAGDEFPSFYIGVADSDETGYTWHTITTGYTITNVVKIARL